MNWTLENGLRTEQNFSVLKGPKDWQEKSLTPGILVTIMETLTTTALMVMNTNTTWQGVITVVVGVDQIGAAITK